MENWIKPDTDSVHSTAMSTDGTVIAFERRGTGEPLVLVGGALNNRFSDIAGLPMAELLSDDFACVSYDRRGRGDSTDIGPYAVEREIEDLAALIDETGGQAFLFGHSSGAALVLEAAAAGLPVAGLAAYEPPYSVDADADAENRTFTAGLEGLLQEDRRAEATVFFMDHAGVPQAMIDDVKQSPFWPLALAMAPTLAYDMAILRTGGDSHVPRAKVGKIGVPLLAMAGGESPASMREAARSVAEAAPSGQYREFEGENHMVPAHVVAPMLKEFFGEL